MPKFRPKHRHILRRVEEYRALKHPIASALVQLLQDQEMTLQQAADRLGLKAGHLRYHLCRLLEADLIKLTRKLDTGRNLEKYYRAIAYRYTLPARSRRSPEIDRFCVEGHAGLIEEYASRMDRTEGDWIAEINRVRLLPEDLREIRGQIEKLVLRYRKKRARDPDARDYKSLWMCFPIAGTGSEALPMEEAGKERKGGK
jgi:DNA-binding transcriptional ArsR family regulator